MLIGEYTHTIDIKKRVSLPTKFRSVLGKKMIMTKGADNCVYVYPLTEWKKWSEKLSKLSMGSTDQRKYKRLMTTGAAEVEVDSVGRVLIPDFLKIYAGLKMKVVFTGVGNYAEIWDEKAWRTYREKIENQVDVLAEKLGELGAI